MFNVCRSFCFWGIGGTAIKDDVERLRAGQHMVVGTPGRVFDMVNKSPRSILNMKDEHDISIRYHDLSQYSQFISLLFLVRMWMDAAANQRLVNLNTRSGSLLLASIALKSVIMCHLYSFIHVFFCVLCLCTISHGLRNNLRVDDLKVFVLDEASFLGIDFPNCFFNVCCILLLLQGLCFVMFCLHRPLAWLGEIAFVRPMSWCHVVSRRKTNVFVNSGCHFGLHVDVHRCPRVCFFSSLVPRGSEGPDLRHFQVPSARCSGAAIERWGSEVVTSTEAVWFIAFHVVRSFAIPGYPSFPFRVQVCLFSATMAPEILDMTSKFMRNAVRILVKKDGHCHVASLFPCGWTGRCQHFDHRWSLLVLPHDAI